LDKPDKKKDLASVRRQAAAGGLRFEAYLPPDLAEWVIGLVEQEVFHSPSEAVFVAMQSFRELEDHPDVKQELLARIIQTRVDAVEDGVPTVLEQKTTICCKYLSLHGLAIVAVPKKALRGPVYGTSTPSDAPH